jgi:acrylyl-CoA reductase (NADPH)
MAVGTAGLTAALCLRRLEASGVRPDDGPILVTGATGGVGSFAVWVLARLGYEVHAATGKAGEYDYLRSLGAAEVIDRAGLAGEPRPLGKETWAAGIDSVGGTTLANLLSQVRYGGAVAACGLAGGSYVTGTVLPFILRNVSLLGVDSVNASTAARHEAWSRLAELFTAQELRQVATDARLEDVPDLSRRILAGGLRGRAVVDIAGFTS